MQKIMHVCRDEVVNEHSGAKRDPEKEGRCC